MGIKEQMKEFNENKPTIDIKLDVCEDGVGVEITSDRIGKREVFAICGSLLNGLADSNDVHVVEVMREMTIIMMTKDLSSRGDK